MKKKNQTSLASKYWLLIVSAICIVLMILSIVADNKGRNSKSPLRSIASYTVVPMQKGINKVGMLIGDITKNFETLQDMKKENNALQEKVDALTIENSRLQQESYELERLQTLYKLDSNYADYEKVGAHVIGKDSGNWFSTFVIDKGTKDGLAVDMNVMAGTGLVGIITEAGPDWSRVRSIIDDASNVSGMVLSTADTCIVSGDLKLMNDGKIKFEQLANNDSKIEVGEHIVTSHISSKYLQGILIGYVSEINVDSNNLTRSGYITPAIDFKHLQEVLVITTLKQNPSQDSDEKAAE
ncbi:rod shape-determining protein MreC [Lachnospiraceae bacterium LCP25S3_G4]